MTIIKRKIYDECSSKEAEDRPFDKAVGGRTKRIQTLVRLKILNYFLNYNVLNYFVKH